MLIVLVVLHMLRVFFYGAYKSPRELNWVAGCVLLMLVLALGFTGYLLPWDQLSFWATKVGTEIAGAVPLIGGFIMTVLRGGAEITGSTLTRFYAFHVIILPAVLVVFLAAHFMMIRRQGISGPL
jgi:quinol-cytochrome oxidoreductase complex cytochrome b subunit